MDSLQTLYCNNNRIAKLDLRRSAKLARVVCNSNQLDTLLLPSACLLELLECSQNKLTSLVLPQSPVLTEVSCQYNRLNSLMIGYQPALCTLICRVNRLEAIDLTQCPQMEYLFIESNRLTELDLSQNNRLAKALLAGNLFMFSTFPPARPGRVTDFSAQWHPTDSTNNGCLDFSREYLFPDTNNVMQTTSFSIMKRNMTYPYLMMVEGVHYENDNGRLTFPYPLNQPYNLRVVLQNAAFPNAYIYFDTIYIDTLYIPDAMATTTVDELPPFYPNPVVDRLYFAASEQGAAYRLLTVAGVELMSGLLPEELGIGHLPKGLYLLQIVANNRTRSYKVMIRGE